MAKMVDVGKKPLVARRAVAAGELLLKPGTLSAIRRGKLAKGDLGEATQVVALLGAKRVAELLPFCHPLRIDAVRPTLRLKKDRLEVRCEVSAKERTGVEMEALAAVTLALLNAWDMVKALEKDRSGQYPTTRIVNVRIEEKRKG